MLAWVLNTHTPTFWRLFKRFISLQYFTLKDFWNLLKYYFKGSRLSPCLKVLSAKVLLLTHHLIKQAIKHLIIKSFELLNTIPLTTIADKMYEAMSRNQAKLDRTRKLWNLFLRNFWWLVPNFYLRKKEWVLGSVSYPTIFMIFPIFPNF